MINATVCKDVENVMEPVMKGYSTERSGERQKVYIRKGKLQTLFARLGQKKKTNKKNKTTIHTLSKYSSDQKNKTK